MTFGLLWEKSRSASCRSQVGKSPGRKPRSQAPHAASLRTAFSSVRTHAAWECVGGRAAELQCKPSLWEWCWVCCIVMRLTCNHWHLRFQYIWNNSNLRQSQSQFEIHLLKARLLMFSYLISMGIGWEHTGSRSWLESATCETLASILRVSRIYECFGTEWYCVHVLACVSIGPWSANCEPFECDSFTKYRGMSKSILKKRH